MRILILAALIGVVSAVFVQKLTWRESQKTKMIKAGTWAAYKKQKEERLAASRAHGDDSAPFEKFYDYEDVEYFSVISIGTPQQEFRVVMDTGSPALWVTTTACSDEACQEKHQFDPSKSSTYAPTNESFHFDYVTGHSWGHYANETVMIGEEAEGLLVIPNASLGLAERLDPAFLSHPEMDGIFGLSYPMPHYRPDPTLIGAIKRGLLKEPIFTIFYERRGLQNEVPGGQIIFGGLDTENCGPVISYQPLTEASWFEFEVDQLNAGDFQINRTIRAFVDSSSSLLAASQEIIDQIAKAFNAEPNEEVGDYWMDCDQEVSVDLTISGRVYSVSSTNLILDLKVNGKCLVAIGVNRILGSNGPEMILGAPFHRQYCIVHHIDQQLVGFAYPLRN